MTFPIIDPRGLFGKRPVPGEYTYTMDISITRAFKSAMTGYVNRAMADQRKNLMFGIDHADFKRRMRRELNKHPRALTHSRTRTTSSRKRAGSRKGNGGRRILSDYGSNPPRVLLSMN